MAAKQILTPYNFTKNEIQNALFHSLATAPAGAVATQYYWNTTDTALYVHNGVAFRVLPLLTTTLPSGETVNATASLGTSLEAARADHVHATPNVASGTVSGFMSAADKTKLDASASISTVSTLMIRDSSGRAQVENPSGAKDIVNLQTLQSIVQSWKWKASTRAATTGNISISSPTGAAFDGVALTVGQYLLVKDQTIKSQNGVYTFNGVGVPMTRTSEANTWLDLVAAAIIVEEGTLYKDTAWLCTVDQGGTLETTDVTWTYFPGAGSLASGTATTVSAGNVSVNVDGTTIDVNGSNQLEVKALGITDAQVATANKDGLQAAPSMRTLGVGHQQAAAGDHTHTASGIGAVVKFVAVIGDGTNTSYVVNHAFGVRDVIARVYNNSGAYDEVETSVELTDANNVTIRFTYAVAINAYRVVVMG